MRMRLFFGKGHRASAGIVLACACLESPAAPPLATNDAVTLDPGACQLELEHRNYKFRNEADAVAACGLPGELELGIGVLRVAADGEPRQSSYGFGAKKVFVPASDGQWGLGVGAELIRASGNASGLRQYAVVGLATRQFDATAVHLNLGYVDDREAGEGVRRKRATWAAALEHEIVDRWTLVAEIYGQQGLPETGLLGVRWWAVARHVQLFAAVGAERGAGQAGRWISLGIRLETGRPIF